MASCAWDRFASYRKHRANGSMMRRYQPFDCTLPLLTSANLQASLSGRTIIFMGDSVSLHHYTTLVCALNTAAIGADGRSSMVKVFGLTTEGLGKTDTCAFWDAAGIALCFLYPASKSFYGKRPNYLRRKASTIISALQDHAQLTLHDAIVFNIGVMLEKGGVVRVREMRETLLDAATAHSHWHKARSPTGAPLLLWRETGSQGFPGFAYPGRSAKGIACAHFDAHAFSSASNASINRFNAPLGSTLERTGLPVLHVWATTAIARQEYPGNGDCTHFPLHGAVYSSWNEIMLRALEQLRPRSPQTISTGQQMWEHRKQGLLRALASLAFPALPEATPLALFFSPTLELLGAVHARDVHQMALPHEAAATGPTLRSSGTAAIRSNPIACSNLTALCNPRRKCPWNKLAATARADNKLPVLSILRAYLQNPSGLDCP